MSLTLSRVEKRYDDFTLGPVDLSVENAVTAVLGPSGSGKTTLLDLIAGFEHPDGGDILLDGRELRWLPPEERQVGVVFQDYALFPHLTVAGNLAFGADAETRIEETADLLAIGDLLDRMPATLSGGEKQRVALGRALVSEPDALLLDEPLSNLDAPIRRRLQRDLRDILSTLSIPVVYVTHDQDEAATVADSIAVLRDGTVSKTGPVEAVFADPETPFVADFVGVENLLEGTVVSTGPEGTRVDLGWTEFVASDRAAGPAVTVGIRPADLGLEPGDADPDRDNAIRGTVERVVSQRTGTVVTVEGPDGTRLVVRRRETDLPPGVEVGSSVIVTVDPDAVILLE